MIYSVHEILNDEVKFFNTNTKVGYVTSSQTRNLISEEMTTRTLNNDSVIRFEVSFNDNEPKLVVIKERPSEENEIATISLENKHFVPRTLSNISVTSDIIKNEEGCYSEIVTTTLQEPEDVKPFTLNATISVDSVKFDRPPVKRTDIRWNPNISMNIVAVKVSISIAEALDTLDIQKVECRLNQLDTFFCTIDNFKDMIKVTINSLPKNISSLYNDKIVIDLSECELYRKYIDIGNGTKPTLDLYFIKTNGNK